MAGVRFDERDLPEAAFPELRRQVPAPKREYEKKGSGTRFSRTQLLRLLPRGSESLGIKWSTKLVALAALLLGVRDEDKGTAGDLLRRETESLGPMARRKAPKLKPVARGRGT